MVTPPVSKSNAVPEPYSMALGQRQADSDGVSICFPVRGFDPLFPSLVPVGEDGVSFLVSSTFQEYVVYGIRIEAVFISMGKSLHAGDEHLRIFIRGTQYQVSTYLFETSS